MSRSLLSYPASAVLAWLLVITATPGAQADDDWAEWTYRWKQLNIVVRTNAGVFSPSLQALGVDNRTGPEPTRPANLIQLVRFFFVWTTLNYGNQTFQFIEPLARQWGPGHALPILAAVALENVQRPIHTLFGGTISAPVFSNSGQLELISAGGINPELPGTLRIVVYGQPLEFRHAAERTAHASAKAYYDAGRNEVGLLLDMAEFHRFYGHYDKLPDHLPLLLSAFIAYAMDTFNEDSGHELAHVYQQQTRLRAYVLPVIRECEAEVNGMVRRRDGFLFNFLYNTPDAWNSGRFDQKLLKNRVEMSRRTGRPMSPMEVDRLVALKALQSSGRALSTAQLLAMDAGEFFSGSTSDIESRYAQSWALCLLAIRDKSAAQILAQVIDARFAKEQRADLEADLDARVTRLISDPMQLQVTKETVWKDAEQIYAIDPVFAGTFYAWIYLIDPGDVRALIYIGDALYEGGNLHGAMRYYLAARERSGSALPLLRIGDIYSEVGDREAALRTWRDAAVTSEPGANEAFFRKEAIDRPAVKLH
jgi:tetratricopeptide (TPR) repeat protein